MATDASVETHGRSRPCSTMRARALYVATGVCGRYILTQIAKAEREFALVRSARKLSASWNIAPSQSVPIVRVGADGVREGVMMRWGLVPFFAHDEPPKYSTINATIERIETGP